MIKAEIILDTRFKTKKGYPVKIRVYDDITQKHTYVNLKVYQNSEKLKLDVDLRKRSSDLDSEVIFCNENKYNLNDALEVIKNGVPLDDLDLEIELLEKRLEFLKAKKGLLDGIGFIQFSDILIKERELLKMPTDSYTSTKNAVTRYISPNLDTPINNITTEWVKGFDIHYKSLGIKDSSIETYLTIIKAIYVEAQSRESLNIKKDNPFFKMRNFKRDKKEIELTIDDLKAIKDFPLDKIKTQSKFGVYGYRRIMDIYIFQFVIGGHDMLDIATLKWSNIKDDRVSFKRYKNRFKKYEGEFVNNMLCDFAIDVINKYGDKESKRVFSFIPDPEENITKYRYFLNTINTSVFPSIQKFIGTNNKFTSKSTRYLFRTIGGNLLIDSYIMMLLQGHTPQGVTFGYQGAINHEIQDKEHQKILDVLFKE